MNRTEQPVVSVVVPMLDERDAIGHCLDGFAKQTYPLDRLEVVVVDGGSTDGSRELVEERARDNEWVRVVDNPQRRASAAFNAGIRASHGDIVCLFSSHGVPGPDFVARSVEALAETGAAGVGGKLLHEGDDAASRAIGAAMTSPFGMASPFRYANTRREVDTIGHPAYLRSMIDEIGWFDETLERNSDYEFNWRVRAAGHLLVFEPAIVTVYRPRTTIARLGRQFWWYGRWKERVVRRHPQSLRPCHLVPPAAVLGALLSPILLSSWWGRRVLAVMGVSYAALIAVATARTKPRAQGADPVVVAVAFPVMHAAWGAGFLASAAQDLLSLEGREAR